MITAQYRWKRRLVQIATLLLIALIPALGLFRLDLTTASFTILGNRIWWSNISFVFGLALVVVTAPILIYTTFGTAWCGWACPQNLLTEWANNLTHKLLGKRASVDVNGEGMKVAAAKNKAFNWIILGLAFLGASLVLALIPFLFFFSFTEVWSFFTFSGSATLSKFMQRLYLFAAFLIFIDIAVVRYFLCDYACMYRIGQKIFKNRDALHVSYDASRSADCTKCNYCASTCITSIQPTQISLYDSCVDCGECIDACNRLHAKSGTHGLLTFEFGSNGHGKVTTPDNAMVLAGILPLGNNSQTHHARSLTPVGEGYGSSLCELHVNGGKSGWREKLSIVFSRLNLLMGGVFLVGVALMAWAVFTQTPPMPVVPIAVQQKALQVARVCNVQCSKQQASCRADNMAGCYRAAACKCECYLQQDASNSSVGQWQQCLQRNKANADALDSRATVFSAPSQVAAGKKHE